MRGAILPLSNMPSWRGAQLEHRDNFTFNFICYQKSQIKPGRTGIEWNMLGLHLCLWC